MQNDGGKILDESRPMICIPQQYLFEIQSPASYDPSPEISIELDYIQIIEIDVKLNQLTANMEFRIN